MYCNQIELLSLLINRRCGAEGFEGAAHKLMTSPAYYHTVLADQFLPPGCEGLVNHLAV